MTLIDKIMVYGLFPDGNDIGCWDLDTIRDKMYKTAEPFTYAEKHALMFFEEMGNYMGECETWKKPYGSVLNETRKLH